MLGFILYELLTVLIYPGQAHSCFMSSSLNSVVFDNYSSIQLFQDRMITALQVQKGEQTEAIQF